MTASPDGRVLAVADATGVLARRLSADAVAKKFPRLVKNQAEAQARAGGGGGGGGSGGGMATSAKRGSTLSGSTLGQIVKGAVGLGAPAVAAIGGAEGTVVVEAVPPPPSSSVP